jgi:hypothetical protein
VADHATDTVGAEICRQILHNLKDSGGTPLAELGERRYLEKTPKNALRIPFFDRIFPDALFIYLWRDPRENISSIMEAWRSGNWKTYNGLEGFDGPWSLLLPQGFKELNGRPLEEIAAYQWESTNRTVLDDLSVLPSSRWMAMSYDDLTTNTEAAIKAACRFAQFEFDSAIANVVSRPLPASRYTQTTPAQDKWRLNEEAIARVLPTIQITWRRLQRIAANASDRKS